jgi:hypothetical protein
VRIDEPRDESLLFRQDLVADILDALGYIKADTPLTRSVRGVDKTVTFSCSPEVMYWRTDPFSDSGVSFPANILYDQTSDETDNGSQVEHHWELVFRHYNGDESQTAQTIKKGGQDILNLIMLIEPRIVDKYHVTSVRQGPSEIMVEKNDKKYGCIELVIKIVYKTGRWTL